MSARMHCRPQTAVRIDGFGAMAARQSHCVLFVGELSPSAKYRRNRADHVSINEQLKPESGQSRCQTAKNVDLVVTEPARRRCTAVVAVARVTDGQMSVSASCRVNAVTISLRRSTRPSFWVNKTTVAERRESSMPQQSTAAARSERKKSRMPYLQQQFEVTDTSSRWRFSEVVQCRGVQRRRCRSGQYVAVTHGATVTEPGEWVEPTAMEQQSERSGKSV